MTTTENDDRRIRSIATFAAIASSLTDDVLRLTIGPDGRHEIHVHGDAPARELAALLRYDRAPDRPHDDTYTYRSWTGPVGEVFVLLIDPDPEVCDPDALAGACRRDHDHDQ